MTANPTCLYSSKQLAIRGASIDDNAVDSVFDAITGALTSGDNVQFVGFGSFGVSDRAAREGRNPSTGEAIQIAASKQPRFKAGKALKDTVNG